MEQAIISSFSSDGCTRDRSFPSFGVPPLHEQQSNKRVPKAQSIPGAKRLSASLLLQEDVFGALELAIADRELGTRVRQNEIIGSAVKRLSPGQGKLCFSVVQSTN
jgi:hypothetical protein